MCGRCWKRRTRCAAAAGLPRSTRGRCAPRSKRRRWRSCGGAPRSTSEARGVARALIVGCGCRGRLLGGGLMEAGWAGGGTRRRGGGLAGGGAGGRGGGGGGGVGGGGRGGGGTGRPRGGPGGDRGGRDRAGARRPRSA